MPELKEMFVKTGFKKNDAVNEEMLFLYADSVAYSKEKRNYPIAKEIIFLLGSTTIKASDWFAFSKQYKLNKNLYKGESNRELYDAFINQTVVAYFKNHLEEYNTDFRYEVQEFKEGNLMYEITNRKIWNKSSNDINALKAYYEANKDHFLWGESAEVILINSKSYAYADYAYENIKKGMDWKKICDNSEGMTQGDSSRYELSQLPIKTGTQLTEGAVMEIVKNDFDEGASFIKVIKLYPAKMPRSFEEAKSLVINEYQKSLEESWMKELAMKYPVKINSSVFQSLLK
jgi:peptidyl-prolyl cis-trans isomerase SurA